MKKHINNPYKVNWKMYNLIGGISVLIMIVAVVWNNYIENIISDIVKNLAFGCVASTIIALLIEIGNIKDKNEKANSVYDAVFRDLQSQIRFYVETWARLCSVAFKNKDYRKEKHTWTEWYETTKNNFLECDEDKQVELMGFFSEELLYCINSIEKTIEQIDQQQYILKINDVYDDSLKSILNNYKYEFYEAKLTLEREYNKENFWGMFDAIKQDLTKYIYNWVDIRYYNYYRFKPYEIECDKTEFKHALLESWTSNE